MDLSPVLISLQTAAVSIFITFFLGLAAAFWVHGIRRPVAKTLLDGLFTLPLVLPPTVAGFFLLYLFGVRRPLGEFLLNFLGVKIVFSWPATVLAAVSLSFPLMYRGARGAFAQVDETVLSAARTIGMGEWAIFWRPTHLAQARLTGCKNFSRAKALGPTRVRALDWDMKLDVAAPLPKGFSHIGVRTHNFFPAGAGTQNAIPVRVTQRVESPFEWNVLFQNAGQNTGPSLWWKYPKGAPVDENPKALSVMPENVLLLINGNE